MMECQPNSSNQSVEQPRRCRRSRSQTVLRSVIALGCLLLATISGAQAQEVGEDICACSPSTYEFTFNFDLACPRPGGEYGPGIDEVTCFVTSFSAEVEDLTAVSVQTISIIEADVDRVPIAQSAIEGDYEDGSTFTYSSVAALGNSSQIPQSIQLTITGLNAQGDSLVLVWAIKFSNDCGIYPVLETGESFGWTEFVSNSCSRNCWQLPQRLTHGNATRLLPFYLYSHTNRLTWAPRATKFVLSPLKLQQLLSPLLLRSFQSAQQTQQQCLLLSLQSPPRRAKRHQSLP